MGGRVGNVQGYGEVAEENRIPRPRGEPQQGQALVGRGDVLFASGRDAALRQHRFGQAVITDQLKINGRAGAQGE